MGSGNGPPPISGALTSSSSSPPPSSSSALRKDRRKKLRRSSSESVPGRVCSNSCSRSTALFTKQGRKGVNQDAMVVWENFGSKEDTTFCGVFDGHGPYGHFVAKRIRNSLPSKLSSAWELISNSKNVSSLTRSNSKEEEKEEEEHNELFSMWKDSFLKAFRVMDKELKLDPNIDCYCSGSTAVTLVKKGQDLVIGNVGDSRAVLGTRDGDNRYVAVQLTVDLKPNIPKEAERIRRCKGRVFALRCEPEVSRVWLPSCDSPGLAMARAFGDFCLKDFGLISVPDIYHHRIADRDEFVVLATDGIWDVLSNEEVVEIVGSGPRATSARAVAETAVRAWRSKFPSAKVDDCAVVCLFLNSSLNE